MASASAAERLARRAGVLGRVVAESDPGAGSQGFDRRDEVEVLGLAEEADGVAASLATEAVVAAELGVDRERTRLFASGTGTGRPSGCRPGAARRARRSARPGPWQTWSVRRLRRQYPRRKTKAARGGPERRCSPGEACGDRLHEAVDRYPLLGGGVTVPHRHRFVLQGLEIDRHAQRRCRSRPGAGSAGQWPA